MAEGAAAYRKEAGALFPSWAYQQGTAGCLAENAGLLYMNIGEMDFPLQRVAQPAPARGHAVRERVLVCGQRFVFISHWRF